MAIFKATFEWGLDNEISLTVEIVLSIATYEEELWPSAMSRAREKLLLVDDWLGRNAKLIKMELIAD